MWILSAIEIFVVVVTLLLLVIAGACSVWFGAYAYCLSSYEANYESQDRGGRYRLRRGLMAKGSKCLGRRWRYRKIQNCDEGDIAE